MRMAGRFSRRVRGYAKANAIPIIDCGSDDRKHQIAEEHLKKNPSARGLFMILVARAPATVWEVRRSKQGIIRNLESKRAFINHYSFHIMDPDWGHITFKLAGHPPFGAQIMLNGHEYVACQARINGIPFPSPRNDTARSNPECDGPSAARMPSLPSVVRKLAVVGKNSGRLGLSVSSTTNKYDAHPV